MFRFKRLVGVLALAAMAWPVLGAKAPKVPVSNDLKGSFADVYVKKGTWVETMLASREAYAKWKADSQAKAPVTLGQWYVSKTMGARGLGDVQFAEKSGVDVREKGRDGKAIWQGQGNWMDETIQPLPVKDNQSIYLFRTVKAARAVKVNTNFGAKDGLAVWLNEKLVFSKDVACGVQPDQYSAELNLVQGENRLLLKVFNRGGDSGFYFSMLKDPARALWSQIETDFPAESAALRQDLPNNAHLQWFAQGASINYEHGMIGKALEGIGNVATAIKNDADNLKKSKAPAGDPRWLQTYLKASDLRKSMAAINNVNLVALRRAVDDLTRTFGPRYPRGAEFLQRIDTLQKNLVDAQEKLAKQDAQGATLIAQAGGEAAKLQREALLSNPLIDFDKLLLIKRATNHLGLPQNWQGNCALPKVGYDNEIATLALSAQGTKLTTLYKPAKPVFVGNVYLHFDAGRMLFAMPGANDRWQVYEIKSDGTALRQVTTGEEPDVDNYDPCYRPDGKIIYASTMCFQGVPCVGGSNTVANLVVCDPDGKTPRQLTFDQDHDWCPTVLNDGRIMFTRWEYSDTAHYFTRILMRMNPDGTAQTELYGSNSYWPNSLFYARPIPNDPSKVVAIVSGHHGVPRMGELVLFDTARGQREADGVVQRIPGHGKPVEPVIVDGLVNGSWPKFIHPQPLSDKYIIVACQPNQRANWGIYLVDTFDNMLLLAEMPGYALLEPIPLRKTPTPPVIPDRVNPKSRDANVYIADIYTGEGLKGVPRGQVKTLRLSSPYYTYPRMGGHKNIGVEGPWDARIILGTVPVNDDGSAYFKAPANMPITVQPLDDQGRALQIMRSWFVGMPGETVSCAGCHEKQGEAANPRPTKALAYAPTPIKEWNGPMRGFSFKRDVQSVLDQYCVGCHDGKYTHEGKLTLDFSAKEKNGWGNFTPSYLNLHPWVRRPGPESDDHLQVPLEFSADTSELVQMLKKGHYNVKLDNDAWDRLYTWIDLNVPDHGTWSEHRAIPGDMRERRLAMRIKYANRPEDFEIIPEIKRSTAQFMQPAPLAPVAQPKVDCPNWPLTPEQARALQQQAGSLTRKTLDLGSGQKIELVRIPAGEFVMGSATGDADERPLARVRIAKAFWMSTTEITNAQFKLFDPAHDSGYIDQHHKDHTTPGYPNNLPDQPVVRVAWKEAMTFCNWLAARTNAKVTLPTESQWEWACRAGSAAPFFYGDLNTDFATFANLADASIKLLAVSGVNPKPIANPSPNEDFIPKDNRFNDGEKVVANIGKYKPNAWGLFDMHGNVAEWTRTSYRPYPYVDVDGRNDLAEPSEKVVRGGSWLDRPKRATSSFRLAYRSYHPVHNVGIRIIIEE